MQWIILEEQKYTSRQTCGFNNFVFTVKDGDNFRHNTVGRIFLNLVFGHTVVVTDLLPSLAVSFTSKSAHLDIGKMKIDSLLEGNDRNRTITQ